MTIKKARTNKIRLREVKHIYNGRRALRAAVQLSLIAHILFVLLVRQLNHGPTARLISEAAVLVLAEQRQTDGRQSVGLEQPQTLLEGVVDLDLAGAVEDGYAASAR